MEITPKTKDSRNFASYTIQNIVVKSSLNLNSNIDLKRMAKTIENANYEKSHFPGLFLRIRNSKCVVIIFKNGKLILTCFKII